jgi:arabinose-5-phosphate isomerase
MYLEEARKVIEKEREGLTLLIKHLGASFEQAVESILACTHHVVISGMGKAGLIGSKISATLASTGTPSFFMHPGEAMHGDLGMLRPEDVVILMSYGGETEEITRLLPILKVTGNRVIAITRSRHSTLGKRADVVLETGSLKEACPLGLAPTTSTTAMLVLGDALAVVLLKKRNFDEKKFAFFHPGGTLGKKMLKVGEIMRKGERCPILSDTLPLKDVIVAISQARAGAAIIKASNGKLTGVFTDGDLRRHLSSSSAIDVPVKKIMTRDPKSILEDDSALEAVAICKRHMIGDLPVINRSKVPVGLIDLKDLVNIGLLDL